jgi:CHASE2 domain-containing sensor protein
MLRRLAGAGARLIVYDVDFHRPSDLAADDALYDAAGVARPVVFGTAGIRADGTTQVLGGDQNLRSIGARAAAGLLPRDADGVVRPLLRVLVFCLTGAPPFPRATVSEMLAAHLTAPRRD